MNISKQFARLFGLALIALLAVGCLVSGTFVIAEDISFNFSAASGFYFSKVDITANPDWAEHRDDIDDIDVVGFDFYISSTESGPVTFSAYIDNYSADSTVLPDSTKRIINGFTVNPGLNQHITYKQSLTFLTNTELLKTLAKTGKFYYWGTSTGNDGSTFHIDSGQVIVTVSASGS